MWGGGGSYHLPTASASVKGGVKVGSGLKMEGEALGVDPDTQPTVVYENGGIVYYQEGVNNG